jgi:hypothetical protein
MDSSGQSFVGETQKTKSRRASNNSNDSPSIKKPRKSSYKSSHKSSHSSVKRESRNTTTARSGSANRYL